MDLSKLISKVLKLNCTQGYPDKKQEYTKIKKLPSILNLRKKYSTFVINHTFTDLSIPVILSPSGESTIELVLNYNYFTYSEIINFLCNKQMPVSFETIGDVIHFNLNNEHLPYKYIIGKILYDKTGCNIINKLGNINSKFRCYEFEYIGGKVDISYKEDTLLVGGTKYTFIYNKTYENKEQYFFSKKESSGLLQLQKEDFCPDILDKFIRKYSDTSKIIEMDRLETSLIENGARFIIDIRNVYWCSKLQDERRRLLDICKRGQVVCDVFCGVGPMVVPLLLKGCTVYANDLNSKAIECLKKNIKINKIKQNFFISNEDAKDFLEGSLPKIDHYILNLPEYSLDYLQYIKSGMIHCYFFSNEDFEDLVYEKTGLRNANIRFIRKVSPSKNVYKLTYQK
ncbi:hypothetical protein P3W45_000014 [Vairimorpha bombi]